MLYAAFLVCYNKPMKTYIVGNWKMNLNVGESSLYLHKLLKNLKIARGVEVVIAPTFLALQPLSLQIDRKRLKLAAQNCNAKDFGAYTGEVSISMLKGVVDYVIIGHSERRNLFSESDKDIRSKVAAAVNHNITPILCIGETESEKTFGETQSVLSDQLLGGLEDVSKEDLRKVIVAYEPVWAISTTKGAVLASPDDIANSVNIIRDQLKAKYGKDAEDIPVLYGGSVNPSNAGAYLTIPGVNGLLIGGASLISDHFNDIIETAKRVTN